MKNKREVFYLTEILSGWKRKDHGTTKHKSYQEALDVAVQSGLRYKISRVERTTSVDVVVEREGSK